MNEEKEVQKDWIGRHHIITRSAMIALIGCAVFLVVIGAENVTLIEYVFWSLVWMFSALLFGDKMLLQVKDIVKAWKGNND